MEADETWGSTNLNKSESATQLISDAEDGPLLEASTDLIPLKPTGQQHSTARVSSQLMYFAIHIFRELWYWSKLGPKKGTVDDS